jgi:two-component system response regulator HydG
LQEREFNRVGGEATIQVDVRVIAATNKDLMEQINDGVFREDLYYRLNVVELEVPPLSHRKEDIPLLAQHFLETFVAKNRKEIKGFTPKAMDNLIRYDWPGNVRELMNAVERGVVLARTDYLDVTDFSFMQNSMLQTDQDSADSAALSVKGDVPLEEIEKAAILSTLQAAGGNKSEAARRLGITRKTLHKKLKAYGEMP